MFLNFLGYNLNVMFNDLANKIYLSVSKIPFDFLVWFVWGSYLAIFLIALVLTIKSKRVRAASKLPFLCLTNAYAGVNLALFLLKCDVAQSVLTAALFWVIGYVLYGGLCAFTKKRPVQTAVQTTVAAIPAAVAAVPAPAKRFDAPAVKNTVRLEHAASVTEKLLTKNLAKSDRQELEKLKSVFAVLKIKGELTPAETEMLNENFNTLLKLMAKYNV